MAYIYYSFAGMALLGEEQSIISKLSFGNIGFPEATVIKEIIWTGSKYQPDAEEAAL
jgi:hypothetical protein